MDALEKYLSAPSNKSLFALSRMATLPVFALAFSVTAAHAATLSISANPVSVTSGAASTLTWTSTGATSCAASGVWSGVKATSGSQNVTTSNGLSTYALNCSGPAGSASNTVVIGAGATPPALYALNVSVSGSGTVTSNPSGIVCGATCSASYPSGAVVTLSAVPATGYTFSSWSGACTGTGACTTTLSAARSVTATFASTTSNAIPLSLVPARTSGVAPLSVFFDATGTTDTSVTTRPFHDLEYRWNFGDASAGTWANGAQPGVSSKNTATGPVAAHVFETPGTYTVTMTAFDGTNTNTTSTTITVQDPDAVFVGANTICFSTSANYTGCPTGALQVQTSNFTSAINGNMAPNRRLLFRRGETFTAATSATINQTGPGIIGAYGTGVAPVVQMTGNTTVLLVSSSTTPTLKDWRVMDLDLDGTSSTTNSYGINAGGGFNQFLALRVNGRNIMRGVEAHVSVLGAGHTVWEDWAVVDSSFISSGATGCVNCAWRVYLAGKRAVIQGNFLDYMSDPAAQHVIRSGYLNKGIMSNNTLARSGPSQHIIKLHAPKWQVVGVTDPTGAGSYTEQVVIADNKIVAGNNNWLVGLGPQNADVGTDERVRDIIVERNWFQAGPQTGAALLVWGSETTVRNNICDMTGALSHRCFHVNQRGIEPPPDNVRIYSNTIFSSSTGNFYGVTLGSNATNVSVINNLGSAPSATSPTMINGAGGAGLISSNNLIASPASLFVNATPTIPVHFGLQSLPNPARDTGLSTVPVFSDFFRASGPQNGAIDIGAVEGP